MQLLSPIQEQWEEAEEAEGSSPSPAALVPCALWSPGYCSPRHDRTCTLGLQLLLLTPAATQTPVLSPMETWGGTSSSQRASPPTTDQGPTASSAYAPL